MICNINTWPTIEFFFSPERQDIKDLNSLINGLEGSQSVVAQKEGKVDRWAHNTID